MLCWRPARAIRVLFFAALAVALSGCLSLLERPTGSDSVERPPAPPIPADPGPGTAELLPPDMLVRAGLALSVPAPFLAEAGDTREEQPLVWIEGGGVTAAVSIVGVREGIDYFRYLADQALSGPLDEARWEGGAPEPWRIISRWVPSESQDDADEALAEYHAVRYLDDRAAAYVWIRGPAEAAAPLLTSLTPTLRRVSADISARWTGWTGFSVTDRSLSWVGDLQVDGAPAIEAWVPPDAAARGWNLWIIDADVADRIAEVEGERRLTRISVTRKLETGAVLGGSLDARPAETWLIENYTGIGLMLRWTRASGSRLTIVLTPDEASVAGRDNPVSVEALLAWFEEAVAPGIILGEEIP